MNGLVRGVRRAPLAFAVGVAIAAVMAAVFVPTVFALHRSRDAWSVSSDPLSLIALVANVVVVALYIVARRARGEGE